MRRLVLLFIIVVIAVKTEAAHIVGGEMFYECISVDNLNDEITIKVTVFMYRDNQGGGAEFDPLPAFGVYLGGGNSWSWVESIDANLLSNTKLAIINPNPCLQVPNNVGVDKAVYEFRVRLKRSTQTYMIAYQRCCRNQSVTNIIDPGDTGAAFSIEITTEAQYSCNSSPRYTGFPPIVICRGENLNYDHSATDAEGDELKYFFCNPLAAGGVVGNNDGGDPFACDGVTPRPSDCLPPFAKVNYKVPAYTFLEPIPGNPVITIDSITGLITGIPTNIGQYVVGVCVKEYRAGVYIGEARRDFQFNVTKCDPLVFALLGTGDEIDDQVYEILSCGENTVHIKNESYLEPNIINYYWEFDINGTVETFDTRDVTITFPSIGTYPGFLILNKGTQCADTADINVKVFPAIDADYSFDYDTCFAGPVDFTDLSITGSSGLVSWDWMMDTDGNSVVQHPSYTFEDPGNKEISLIATDINNCKDTITKNIPYFPVPSVFIVEPSSFIGCAPASVLFDNLSQPIDESYTINWTFGDGESSNELSPSHTYIDPGTYDVSLEVISPLGCVANKFFDSWIEIREKPFADFSFSPDEPSVFRNEVFFNNLSERAIGYSWKFGNESVVFDENPSFTFENPGEYEVRLIAKNDKNCTDTAIYMVNVIAPVLLHYPNAFTPNNDGLNDNFVPKGYFPAIEGYSLEVFNRWGERIFVSTAPEMGWNGQKNNVGKRSPMGVYIFVASYLDEKSKRQTVKGHINLIR